MPTALIMLLNSDAVVLLKKGIVLEVEKKALTFTCRLVKVWSRL